MFVVNEAAAKKLIEMSEDNNCEYTFKWATYRRRFTIKSASQFFIGVMLDKLMTAERAWAGGEQIVDIYFNTDDIWNCIRKIHINKLSKIISDGFDNSYNDTIYRGSYCGIDSKFPRHLKNNSKIMIDKYQGNPRNIWNVNAEDVEIIYERFIEFDGIGDALAKMAQFILVRKHGVAGGIESKRFLKVKPDRHVCKVVKRLGISETDRPNNVIESIDNLDSDSQADIDAILFNIGREFCFSTNPQCERCPFDNECAHNFS